VRLSDIMSAMQLASYAEVALVLFMAAFLAIGVNLFRRGNAGAWERARHLPLETEHSPISANPSRDVPTLTSRR
jgi:predicted tellurium resistance membrane protein TerC